MSNPTNNQNNSTKNGNINGENSLISQQDQIFTFFFEEIIQLSNKSLEELSELLKNQSPYYERFLPTTTATTTASSSSQNISSFPSLLQAWLDYQVQKLQEILQAVPAGGTTFQDTPVNPSMRQQNPSHQKSNADTKPLIPSNHPSHLPPPSDPSHHSSVTSSAIPSIHPSSHSGNSSLSINVGNTISPVNITTKKKRLNPSQLNPSNSLGNEGNNNNPSFGLSSPSSLSPHSIAISTQGNAFLQNFEETKDLRQELLERKPSLTRENQFIKGISIKESFLPQQQHQQSLLQPKKLIFGNFSNISSLDETSIPITTKTKRSLSQSFYRELEPQQYQNGIQRISFIYSSLILSQDILIYDFLSFLMKFLGLDFHRLHQILSNSEQKTEITHLLINNFFISYEIMKLFLQKLFERLLTIFKSFGSLILKNLVSFPIIQESPKILRALNDIIEHSENEYPGTINSNGNHGTNSSNPFPSLKSFMKHYNSVEDNRLEQRTKVRVVIKSKICLISLVG